MLFCIMRKQLLAVEQERPREGFSRLGRDDAALKAVPYQLRDLADVIDMRVRDKKKRDRRRIIRKFFPIYLLGGVSSLREAAVDQKFRFADIKQEVRAGYRPCPAYEMYR